MGIKIMTQKRNITTDDQCWPDSHPDPNLTTLTNSHDGKKTKQGESKVGFKDGQQNIYELGFDHSLKIKIQI